MTNNKMWDSRDLHMRFWIYSPTKNIFIRKYEGGLEKILKRHPLFSDDKRPILRPDDFLPTPEWHVTFAQQAKPHYKNSSAFTQSILNNEDIYGLSEAVKSAMVAFGHPLSLRPTGLSLCIYRRHMTLISEFNQESIKKFKEFYALLNSRLRDKDYHDSGESLEDGSRTPHIVFAKSKIGNMSQDYKERIQGSVSKYFGTVNFKPIPVSEIRIGQSFYSAEGYRRASRDVAIIRGDGEISVLCKNPFNVARNDDLVNRGCRGSVMQHHVPAQANDPLRPLPVS